MPACAALLRAVAILRDLHSRRLRKLPEDAPFAFVRQSWRCRIGGAQIDRQLYAFCVYVKLRDRLRAGDVWVEGSRRYRSVEDQLIARALFAAMQAANPLPIPAPRSAAAWLADRGRSWTDVLRTSAARLTSTRWRTSCSPTAGCGSHR